MIDREYYKNRPKQDSTSRLPSPEPSSPITPGSIFQDATPSASAATTFSPTVSSTENDSPEYQALHTPPRTKHSWAPGAVLNPPRSGLVGNKNIPELELGEPYLAIKQRNITTHERVKLVEVVVYEEGELDMELRGVYFRYHGDGPVEKKETEMVVKSGNQAVERLGQLSGEFARELEAEELEKLVEEEHQAWLAKMQADVEEEVRSEALGRERGKVR